MQCFGTRWGPINMTTRYGKRLVNKIVSEAGTFGKSGWAFQGMKLAQEDLLHRGWAGRLAVAKGSARPCRERARAKGEGVFGGPPLVSGSSNRNGRRGIGAAFASSLLRWRSCSLFGRSVGGSCVRLLGLEVGIGIGSRHRGSVVRYAPVGKPSWPRPLICNTALAETPTPL